MGGDGGPRVASGDQGQGDPVYLPISAPQIELAVWFLGKGVILGLWELINDQWAPTEASAHAWAGRMGRGCRATGIGGTRPHPTSGHRRFGFLSFGLPPIVRSLKASTS